MPEIRSVVNTSSRYFHVLIDMAIYVRMFGHTLVWGSVLTINELLTTAFA